VFESSPPTSQHAGLDGLEAIVKPFGAFNWRALKSDQPAARSSVPRKPKGECMRPASSHFDSTSPSVPSTANCAMAVVIG